MVTECDHYMHSDSCRGRHPIHVRVARVITQWIRSIESSLPHGWFARSRHGLLLPHHHRERGRERERERREEGEEEGAKGRGSGGEGEKIAAG